MDEELNEDGRFNEISEEEYFFEVFNTISEELISDEYFDRNKGLLIDISNTLRDMDIRNSEMPPNLARRVIEGVFAAIQRNGIR